MQHLYPDPSPCRTSPPETWLPSQPPTTQTLPSPHLLPRPVPAELSSARIQTPPLKGLGPAPTPQPGSGQTMRPRPRCLRGPRPSPLPLTPVGPQGPGQRRLSVPDLAATPPGRSTCKGGQSGAPPSLQGPLLSPLARPTPLVTLTSGGAILAGSARTASSRLLMGTSRRLARWSETEWELPPNWTAPQCCPPGTKPSPMTTALGQAGPQAISERLVRILCC